jgi:hypothetical protein
MRYRCDESTKQNDGAVTWYAKWMGGPSLAKIENCRLANLEGDMRRTVTITGEPDTGFSQPAECSIAGCKVRGYVTGDDEGNLVFRQTYY